MKNRTSVSHLWFRNEFRKKRAHTPLVFGVIFLTAFSSCGKKEVPPAPTPSPPPRLTLAENEFVLRERVSISHEEGITSFQRGARVVALEILPSGIVVEKAGKRHELPMDQVTSDGIEAFELVNVGQSDAAARARLSEEIAAERHSTETAAQQQLVELELARQISVLKTKLATLEKRAATLRSEISDTYSSYSGSASANRDFINSRRKMLELELEKNQDERRRIQDDLRRLQR